MYCMMTCLLIVHQAVEGFLHRMNVQDVELTPVHLIQIAKGLHEVSQAHHHKPMSDLQQVLMQTALTAGQGTVNLSAPSEVGCMHQDRLECSTMFVHNGYMYQGVLGI